MICRIVAVILFAVIGLFALLCGILSNQVINAVIRKQLSQRLPLVNGSQTLSKWSNVRVPIYMKYHILSIKNVDEALKGEQPVFEEKGPYVFRQKVKKEVLEWNEDETLITFKSRKTYFFEPSMSNGNLSDVVFIPNLPVLAIITKVMEKAKGSWWTRNPAIYALDSFIDNYEEKAFINLTVGELLFEGKKSEFLYNLKSLTESVNIDLPNIPEDGKFCLMRGKNHTADGNYTIYTGKSGLEEFGSIVRWKNLRSLSFNFDKEDVIQGIRAYKFTIPDEVFSAPRYSERNKCFCNSPESDDQLDVCAYNGMLEMSKCLNGAPLVISLPHFYSSNQSLINSTLGMAPSKEKHETFLKIDPVTGIVLNAAKRLQLNLHIRQSYGITILEKIKKDIYPIAWFEEGAMMDEKTAGDLKAALHNKIALMKKVFLAILIVGVVLILTAIVLLIFIMKADLRRKQEKNAHRNSYVYSNLKKSHDKDEIKNDTNRI